MSRWLIGVAIVIFMVVTAWIFWMHKFRIGGALVTQIPELRSVIAVGNVEVRSIDPKYKAEVTNKEVLLESAYKAGVFNKSGVSLPYRKGSVVDGIVVEVVGRKKLLKEKGWVDRPIKLHYDGTESPVLTWEMDVSHIPRKLHFWVVLDDRVIAKKPWSEKEVSLFVSTQVLAVIKMHFELNLFENAGVWGEVESLLNNLDSKDGIPIILKFVQ